MTECFYQELLSDWCANLPNHMKAIRVFEKVRDIPYGSVGEREPAKVLETNLGSCSGKHILLNGLFRALGFQSKVKTCLQYFQEALPPENNYPERLKEIICNCQVVDFHHFVTVEINGVWIQVDATWDAALSDYGFNVNLDWDGKSDTVLAVEPISFYPDTEDIIALKERLIAEMDPKERQIRSEFFALLTDWLQTIRK